MKSFLANLLIALVWHLLRREPSAAGLALGFLIGLLLLAAFPTVLDSRDYVRRAVALLRFTALFCWEFILSNLTLAYAVLFRSPASLSPDFVRYDVAGLSLLEKALTAHFISLTPGTTAIGFEDGGRTLLIHAFDAHDAARLRGRIDRRIRGPLSELLG